MKIGVYSICKNEKENFATWWNNVKDADAIFCLDTGSTDGTLDLLQELYDITGNGFHYNHYSRDGSLPFRFDKARNMAMHALTWGNVDLDYLVWVDFDETLEEGWIEKLKRLLEDGKPDMAQFTFKLGSSTFYQGRAHKPGMYVWEYPAHEVLLLSPEYRENLTVPERIQPTDIRVTQPVKDERPNYTELLELGYEEYKDGRSSYYLGREYYYDGRWEDASSVLRFCLYHGNGWICERGEAANMLSVVHEKLNAPEYVEKYLHMYAAYCNLQREPYIELARYFYSKEDWHGVIHYATRALQTPRPVANYLTLTEANYGAVPHDLLMVAYDKLGGYKRAAYHAANCLTFEPHNERFKQNVHYYIEQGVIQVDSSSETEASN